MARCRLCGTRKLVAEALEVCGACLRARLPGSRELAIRAHRKARASIGLPELAPQDPSSQACPVCVNRCRPGEGMIGLCGTRLAQGGRVRPIVGTARGAALSYRHSPLPTNCCASWVCPGCSSSGYPNFSYAPRAERGLSNLAVGYYGCTFDCLYCQSWEARTIDSATVHTARELADAVDEKTSCVCFYGGDPTPQLGHALAAAQIARRRATEQGRLLRFCFETNGAMDRSLLRAAANLALETGGCVKFDLKAHHPDVHLALCGTSNERTLENFAYLASRRLERPEVPLAVAATALVPGYVDFEEVSALARFIASVGPDIPYLLIGFFSCYLMSDLPSTSRQQARRCLAAARKAGLTRVRLTNRFLLRDAPEEARRRPARCR
ncbi:MAG: radical SAM protein [Myxococcales bacterium]|nr:radical SAM protein [Myxococcales bacterium]